MAAADRAIPSGPVPDVPLRVLVPYMRGYGGGVRRVLGDGLPRLAAEPGISVEYAELCRNDEDMADMEGRGVAVNRKVGVPGSGVLSYATGMRRRLDLAASVPRLAATAVRSRAWLATGHVVYVHGYRDLLLAELAHIGMAPWARPALVWHCHGLADRPPRLLRWLARRSTAVVAVSASVRQGLEQLGVRRDRIRLVRNAIDVGEIRRQAAAGVGAPLPARHGGATLLLPSVAVRADKGPHVAVAALATLPEDARLWITGEAGDPAGASHRSSLEALAEHLGVAPRVDFIGRRTDIYAVMAEADVVLVPSLVGEGFGLVAAESMALGTPVVVSDRGALPEVVEHGVSGLVVEAGDPEALAGAVMRLTAESGLAGRLAAAGRRRVEESFDYERWQREVAGVLREVATRPHRGADGRPGGWRGAPSR